MMAFFLVIAIFLILGNLSSREGCHLTGLAFIGAGVFILIHFFS